MNITEDYCSFEVAKLLKEKGFDWHCKHCYKMANDNPYSNVGYQVLFPKPTLQMTMKWLRVHNIFISIICCTYPTLNKVTWIPDITTFEAVFPDSVVECNTYEEACEAALKYCLTNLI